MLPLPWLCVRHCENRWEVQLNTNFFRFFFELSSSWSGERQQLTSTLHNQLCSTSSAYHTSCWYSTWGVTGMILSLAASGSFFPPYLETSMAGTSNVVVLPLGRFNCWGSVKLAEETPAFTVVYQKGRITLPLHVVCVTEEYSSMQTFGSTYDNTLPRSRRMVWLG